MKTSRIKSIIIVTLALVNIFLLALLLSRQSQQRIAYSRSVEQLSLLLSENGILLDSALLPQGTSLPAAQASRSTNAESTFAQKLLGDAELHDVGGISVYQNGSSSLQFRAGGTVEGTVSVTAENPRRLCDELLGGWGYSTDTALRSTDASVSESGSSTVRMLRKIEGRCVFNAPLLFTFEDHVLTEVTGSFLPEVSTVKQATGIDAVTALVRFLDYRNANGIVCTEIVRIEAGYLLQESASAAAKLFPVWQITTNISNYYVNYITGEVLRD